MPRGPKNRTAQNVHRSHAGIIRHKTLDPPCKLSKAAQEEYDRLLGVLQAKGTLDRIDLAVIAECARIKGILDRYHDAIDGSEGVPDSKLVASLGTLTSQRRGLLRELGLSVQPSRSVVRTNPVPADIEHDPVAARIRLS
ncbi:MAG: hypothetical protein ACLQGP_20310 [Isosphaeraceae bacterium]